MAPWVAARSERGCMRRVAWSNRSNLPPSAQKRKRSSSLKPKKRRVQGSVERRPVARVVDGAQAEQRVGHLAAVEVGLAAVDAVRHAGLAQRLLVRLEPGRRAEEERDVAPARRAPRLGVVVARRARPHAPARGLVAVHAHQQVRQGARLRAARGVGLARPARPVLPTEQDGDAGPVAVRPIRLDPLVAAADDPPRRRCRRPPSKTSLTHAATAGVVRKFCRIAVDGSGASRLTRDQRLDLVVEGDVGTTEAVDRLLGVADHEQLAGLEDHVAPRRRPQARARRGTGRSRPAAGRCPGTRRRAGSGSAAAAPAAIRRSPASRSRSRPSRSVKSSRPRPIWVAPAQREKSSATATARPVRTSRTRRAGRRRRATSAR